MKTYRLLLAAILVATLATGCGDGVFCHRPEGADVTQTLAIADITGIELMCSGDVTLRQGDAQSVTVTGAQNIIDMIETDVDGGIWKIDLDGCTRGRNDLKFDITLPTLTYAGIAGSGDISTATSFTDLDNLKLSIAGSGDITGEFHSQTLKTEIAGSGNIRLSGSSPDAKYSIAGSGDISAFGLATDDTEATIAGSGNIKVSATTTLKATITGSGDIYYKGTPAVTTHISGSGNVIHQD